MNSEQRGMAITGTIMLIAFTALTFYICRNGFTGWAVLTGLVALGGISLILKAFGLLEESASTSSGGGAAGLAALFNSMDQKGAENFANLLNQMGESSNSSATPAPAPASPPKSEQPEPSHKAPPAGGGLLASMASTLVAGTVSADSLAPGQFRVVVVDTLFSATSTLKMQALLGASPTRMLAVMAFDENGQDVIQGQDENEKWWKLDDLKEPAVLYVPRDTLPYMKKQPRLWDRVQQCVDD